MAACAADVARRDACAALKKEQASFQPQWSSSLHSAATQARCWVAGGDVASEVRDATPSSSPSLPSPAAISPSGILGWVLWSV